MRRYRVPAAALGSAAFALLMALRAAGLSTTPLVERVSVSSSGGQALAESLSAGLSADGRYVAFASDASNLVPGDTNAARDIFVHDRLTGATERVSVTNGGAQATGPSGALGDGPPRITPDGRYIAFSSEASNLVANDTNVAADVFVRDRVAGTTERVSVAAGGTQGNGNGDSVTPSITADGRYVTFTSAASNLVPGDDNSDSDVFLRDRVTGVTELVSQASDGTHGNFPSGGPGGGPARITPDGRYVAFGSFADNLVAGDTNGFDDVFVRDRVGGTTERVSVATDGTQGNDHSVYPSISDDGRSVAFSSAASTLTPDDSNGASDILLRDRQASTTVRLSDAPGGTPADGASFFPAISGDGTAVAYYSAASNLVPGDTNMTTDVFLQAIVSGAIQRVSAPAGGEANGVSAFAEISADGSVVAFESLASNLVSGDSNGQRDVFAWGKPLRAPSPTPPATATRTPTPPGMPTATRTPTPSGCTPSVGDVNGDGTVNSVDALFILQYVAGLLGSLPNLGQADVNRDGHVTSVDAALLLQYQAGLLFCLPP